MPQVNVSIAGRSYLIACGDGEERRLGELAAALDARAQQLATSVGQVSDARLLVMTGLLMSDELSAVQAKLAERDAEIARLKAGLASAAESLEKSEERLAEVLDGAAARIESIAARLAAA